MMGQTGGGGEGGSNVMRSLCFVLADLLALSYEASKICKLSRKLPADFQELPLPAVTGLVVIIFFDLRLRHHTNTNNEMGIQYNTGNAPKKNDDLSLVLTTGERGR